MFRKLLIIRQLLNDSFLVPILDVKWPQNTSGAVLFLSDVSLFCVRMHSSPPNFAFAIKHKTNV